MPSLLDLALSELPGDLATWPAALGAIPEVDAHEVLAALFEAWVAGQLDATLTARGATYRSFGALLMGLPERFTDGLSAERMADDEVDVRRWCWAPGWYLLSQDEDLMVMNDDCVSALLEEGAAGCPKREYVFGIVEHHVRDQMHHALWDGASTLPERLAWARQVGEDAARAGATDLVDYASRIASYAVQGAVKREDVDQRVFDLRRCHPNRTVPPKVRLEGELWLARLDRANTLPGQLVIDRRTGAMHAEETARRR